MTHITIAQTHKAVVLHCARSASAATTGGCQFKSIYLTSLPADMCTEPRPPAPLRTWLRTTGGLN